jgi:exodeoxyribonuclease-3
VRIATWNVNSVRARLPRLSAWLTERRPDLVCLQETKCLDEVFPRAELEELGYDVAVHGQRTYNGVALLSRRRLEDVFRGFDDPAFDHEARLIGATVGDLIVVCVYVVNGQAVGTERYAYKLEWMARLRRFLCERFDPAEKLVVAGDFNATFDDRDVYDPVAWRERILCSTPERRALAALADCGLSDALRSFTQEGGIYTWWDYRTRAFERGNRGLRIDHLLMSPASLAQCQGIAVDFEARGGERASDHAPVVATLA